MSPILSISIVSHGQSNLLEALLDDLGGISFTDFEVIITINTPETELPYGIYKYPTKIIRNTTPKGYGDNHNNAFMVADGRFFAVLNPDIRLGNINIIDLLNVFNSPQIGLVAPQVISESGLIQDSARKFPTFLGLVSRVFSWSHYLDYPSRTLPFEVDWVGGMFMIFPVEVFREINGFDARRFYMYMEDVDICNRLRVSSWKVIYCPSMQVIHHAQRSSHRNIKYLWWHIRSAVRYLLRI
jgi:N-acetylglucosaminyl-diphospho-decaprenol L-rhamnosyltransferase